LKASPDFYIMNELNQRGLLAELQRERDPGRYDPELWFRSKPVEQVEKEYILKEATRKQNRLKPSLQPDTIRPANAGSPLLAKGELERMARRRFQEPEPELIGNWWYIRVRKDYIEDGERVRRQHREKLCSASKKIREVKRIAAEYLLSINQGLQNVGGGMNFTEYIDKHYTVSSLPLLSKPTQNCYQSMIKNHLKPAFGKLCFREITTFDLQVFFSGMVEKGIEHPTRVKVHTAFNNVLQSAKRYGLIDSNPLKEVTLPPDKRGKKAKFVVTPEQFEKLISQIVEPYATMVYVAVWTGLRVSELCGLKWRCIGTDSISIEERFHRGDWSVPKSEHSAAKMDVLPHVIERINNLKMMTVRVKRGTGAQYYRVVKKSGADDLVFQSVRKGVEMNDHNILSRHIKPAGRAIGLEKVNWHCLRRSFITWAIDAGADPKVVQSMARHSRVGTTLDIYAQVVRGAQQKALEKLSQYVVTNLSQKPSVSSGMNCDESLMIQ
jgi:integrase